MSSQSPATTYPQLRKRCEGSLCGREIVIVILTTGNKLPIDPKPTAKGRVRLLPDGRGQVLRKAELPAARAAGELLYQTHFVDCPQGPQFRTKQRSR